MGPPCGAFAQIRSRTKQAVRQYTNAVIQDLKGQSTEIMRGVDWSAVAAYVDLTTTLEKVCVCVRVYRMLSTRCLWGAHRAMAFLMTCASGEEGRGGERGRSGSCVLIATGRIGIGYLQGRAGDGERGVHLHPWRLRFHASVPCSVWRGKTLA